jgi:FSR family fosmidomycin resistance protein-like MFS transporter
MDDNLRVKLKKFQKCGDKAVSFQNKNANFTRSEQPNGLRSALVLKWSSFSIPHKQLAILSIMHFVNDGLFYTIYFVIPLAALEFDLSFTQASLIKTFFSLFSSLLQYPCALLAGLVNEVGLLAVGTGWVGLGMIIMGLSKGIWPLWISTICGGIGGNAQHPVASSLVSRLFPLQRRGSAMGTLNFGGDVGKAAFGAVMSFLLIYFTWRQALYVVGGGAAVFSFFWYTITHRLSKKSDKVGFPVSTNSGQQPETEEKYRASVSGTTQNQASARLQRRRFIIISAIGMLDNSTRSTLLTFLPFLYLAKGLGKEHLGIYITLVAIGGLLGKLGCGILADYLGNIGMIVATECLTVAFILLCLVCDPSMGLVLAAFLGFFLNGTSSVIYSQVAGTIPASMRTRGFGAFFTFTLSSAAIAPMLFGILGDFFQARYNEWIGVVTIFVGMAAMVLVTIPLAGIFHTIGHSCATSE